MSLYSWKIWTKQIFLYLWKFWTNKDLLLKFCKTVLNPSVKIVLFFQLTPRISTWYFFNIPGNSMSSTPSPPRVVWSFWRGGNFERGGGGGGGREPPLDETRCEEVLINKAFHLTHKENIKKTKEVSRKPGKLWLPDQILINIKILYWEVTKTIKKLIRNWEKVILIVLEIL